MFIVYVKSLKNNIIFRKNKNINTIVCTSKGTETSDGNTL